MSLPSAVMSNPGCGACGNETDFDGDWFVCEDCRIAYDTPDDVPEFLDPDALACGKPCVNWWHGPGRIQTGVSYECGTCELPEGHTSMCWTDCKTTRTEAQA